MPHYHLKALTVFPVESPGLPAAHMVLTCAWASMAVGASSAGAASAAGASSVCMGSSVAPLAELAPSVIDEMD